MLRLFCDRRIVPERYYVAEEEESVFIPPEILKSVAFIYGKIKGEYKAGGTVFFVNMHEENFPNKEWEYAITARHLIDDIKKYSQDDIVYIRLNRHNASPKYIQTRAKGWMVHPSDPTVDVAILPLPPLSKEFDVKTFPFPAFSRGQVGTIPESSSPPPKAAEYMEPVGIGDDVFIAGLFVEHEGTRRNIPIVRIGNIAAMADEPIATKRYGKVLAHLVEVRSIGGLSGSPVFLVLGSMKRMGDYTVFSTDGAGVFYLFGLIHGHYDEEEKRLNMGIALVVPKEKILEVINQDKLVKARKRDMEEMMGKKNLPVLDASLLARSVVETAIGEPLTKLKRKFKKRGRKGSRRASK